MTSKRSRLNATDRFYVGLLIVGGVLAFAAALSLFAFAIAGALGAFG